jgi:hypothetical protein
MAEKKKDRYVVAPGFSFVGKKRAFVSGDEIDENAFSNPKDFQKLLTCKPPRIVKASEEAAPARTGSGADDRKKLEEAVIANGLGKAEDLAALSIAELKKILSDSGVTIE